MTDTATDERYVTLLGQCMLRGFDFDYDSAEKGAPLVGTRQADEWVVDTIHIEGTDGHCIAWRYSYVDDLMLCRVEGSAVEVMAAALDWGSTRALTSPDTSRSGEQ